MPQGINECQMLASSVQPAKNGNATSALFLGKFGQQVGPVELPIAHRILNDYLWHNILIQGVAYMVFKVSFTVTTMIVLLISASAVRRMSNSCCVHPVLSPPPP